MLSNSVSVSRVGGWTLAELADLAARALAQSGVRAASGRVTEVPDPRLIRWYATIGLLDRPTIGPGRVARYGRRHLLQLVAVKRLQAQGLSLAQIQHRLAGATDAQLRAVAQLPAGLVEGGAAEAAAGTAALDPAAGGAAVTAAGTAGTDAGDGSDVTEPAEGPARSVSPPATSRAGRPTAAGSVPPPGTSRPGRSVPARPATGGRFWTTRPTVDAGRDTVARVYGVRVGGLTLLLPTEPGPLDLAEIATAARPLLDLLAARGWLRGSGVLLDGLLDPTEGAGDDPTGAHR